MAKKYLKINFEFMKKKTLTFEKFNLKINQTCNYLRKIN